MDGNGWNEYKQFVVQELKRSSKKLENIEKRLIIIEQEIAIIKTKMYVGSAVIAVIFSGLVSLIVDSLRI
jgi:hypothetical protein